MTRTAKAEAAAQAAAVEAEAAANEVMKVRGEWQELERQRNSLQDELMDARNELNQGTTTPTSTTPQRHLNNT